MGNTQSRVALGLVVLTAAGAGLAGCGSSSKSDGDGGAATAAGASTGSTASDASGVAEAKKDVAQYRATQKFDPAGAAFDASKARGKTIYSISTSSSLPFVGTINGALRESAKVAGVKFQDCENQGTVGEWVKCFNQGIAQKPDLILLNGSPSASQLQPQINAAKKAGIPVVGNHVPLDSQFPAGTLPATNSTGLTAIEPGPFPDAARLMVDYTVANAKGGKVNALLVTAKEVPASNGLVKMEQDRFKQVCPTNCKTTVVNVPVVDWATKMQSQVRTALTRDPTIDWVIPNYDAMLQFVAPAIQTSGRAAAVKAVSFNGTSAALKQIEGGDIVTAVMGENVNWIGWATMDQILRVLSGTTPIDYTSVDRNPTPLRVFDDSNVAETGTPPQDSQGYGDEYKPGYTKLWGLG